MRDRNAAAIRMPITIMNRKLRIRSITIYFCLRPGVGVAVGVGVGVSVAGVGATGVDTGPVVGAGVGVKNVSCSLASG